MSNELSIEMREFSSAFASAALIRHAKYDAVTESLEVTITDGTVYQYIDVPEILANEVINSNDRDTVYRRQIRSVYQRLLKRFSPGF
jgi:hypothetical protein